MPTVWKIRKVCMDTYSRKHMITYFKQINKLDISTLLEQIRKKEQNINLVRAKRAWRCGLIEASFSCTEGILVMPWILTLLRIAHR